MKKSDLKDGMVVETRVSGNYMVLADKLIRNAGYINLDAFDENLNNQGAMGSNFDIMKVYKVKYATSLNFENMTLEKIWKREEVDWSKVPVGTKVYVDDYDNDCKEDKSDGDILFIKQNDDGTFKVIFDDRSIGDFRYCKLAEEPKEKVTAEELNNNWNEYDCTDVTCEECEYQSDDCKWLWLLDNYNVTRKGK